MLKGYSFFLYFLGIVAFFFGGVTFAGIVEAGKNQGLAGGAIVFGYGVIGAFFGLLIALFIASRTNRKIIFRLNIILAISIVCFYGYYHLKYLERQKIKTLEKQKRELLTKAVTPEAKPLVMLSKYGLNKSIFRLIKNDVLDSFYQPF